MDPASIAAQGQEWAVWSDMPERRYAALGQRIQNLREAHDWSPSALAPRIGCSVSALYAIEAGRARPGLGLLARIATVLDADYGELAQLAGHTQAE